MLVSKSEIRSVTHIQLQVTENPMTGIIRTSVALPEFLSGPFSCFFSCKMVIIAPDIRSPHDCNHKKEAE